MTVAECMSRMSYKEYLTRVRWRELQWNRPNRSDYYTMRLIQSVKQLFAKESIKLSDQRIEFKIGDEPQQSPEAVKGMFTAMAGMFNGLIGRKAKTTNTARKR
jgi:hypothetical protein